MSLPPAIAFQQRGPHILSRGGCPPGRRQASGLRQILVKIPGHAIRIEVGQFPVTGRMFYQGRAMFDPVTGITIRNCFPADNLRLMHVTANDAIVTAALRITDCNLLKFP